MRQTDIQTANHISTAWTALMHCVARVKMLRGGQSFERGPMTQATPCPAKSMIPRQIHYILSLFAKFEVLFHSQVLRCPNVRYNKTTASPPLHCSHISHSNTAVQRALVNKTTHQLIFRCFRQLSFLPSARRGTTTTE